MVDIPFDKYVKYAWIHWGNDMSGPPNQGAPLLW